MFTFVRTDTRAIEIIYSLAVYTRRKKHRTALRFDREKQQKANTQHFSIYFSNAQTTTSCETYQFHRPWSASRPLSRIFASLYWTFVEPNLARTNRQKILYFSCAVPSWRETLAASRLISPWPLFGCLQKPAATRQRAGAFRSEPLLKHCRSAMTLNCHQRSEKRKTQPWEREKKGGGKKFSLRSRYRLGRSRCARFEKEKRGKKDERRKSSRKMPGRTKEADHVYPLRSSLFFCFFSFSSCIDRLIEYSRPNIWRISPIRRWPANDTTLAVAVAARRFRLIKITENTRCMHTRLNNETTTFHSPRTPLLLLLLLGCVRQRSRFSFPLIFCNCKRMNEVPSPLFRRTNEQYLLRGCSLCCTSARHETGRRLQLSPRSTNHTTTYAVFERGAMPAFTINTSDGRDGWNTSCNDRTSTNN